MMEFRDRFPGFAVVFSVLLFLVAWCSLLNSKAAKLGIPVNQSR